MDEFIAALQTKICAALEAEDGQARFLTDEWQRPGGGGGITCVISDGAVFEKGGVNISMVHGELKPDFAAQLPGDGLAFTASGISLVLHPKNPMVPTVHANFRCLSRGATTWYGGGADLTPYYPVAGDVVHFHRVWKRACDAHDPTYYPRFKKWCDEYFYLPHRGETRGVGGIFFDQLPGVFPFVRDAGEAFLDAYLPIVQRRKNDPYTEKQREFQLLRRGRYVEFNLLYDRGTTFGLKTDGRVESILMSLPPLVRWQYDPKHPDEPGLRDWLRPRDWLGD